MSSVATAVTQKLQTSVITPALGSYTSISAASSSAVAHSLETTGTATLTLIKTPSNYCSLIYGNSSTSLLLPSSSLSSSPSNATTPLGAHKTGSSIERPLKVSLSTAQVRTTTATPLTAAPISTTTHMLKNVDSCANRPANEAEGEGECHAQVGDELHADAEAPADTGLAGERRVSIIGHPSIEPDSGATLAENEHYPTTSNSSSKPVQHIADALSVQSPADLNSADPNSVGSAAAVGVVDDASDAADTIAAVTAAGNIDQGPRKRNSASGDASLSAGESATLPAAIANVARHNSREAIVTKSAERASINAARPNSDGSPLQLRPDRNGATTDAGSTSKSVTASSVNSLSAGGACAGAGGGRTDEDSVSKSSDTSGELTRGGLSSQDLPSTFANLNSDRSLKGGASTSRLSERAKKKSWYNVLYPNYKSRSQDFKKLFRDLPGEERLIVDYSCALQRDILVQGRLYVSQNYVCFHANIFGWETYVDIRWKDVTSITKEKTALVIPNAISICTASEKYFFATFTSRDKSFLMLFRVWQNTLMNKQMPALEVWQWVHKCYGDELGLTTDDEDYIDPSCVPAIETETDLEFSSALDELSSLSSVGLASLTTATRLGVVQTTQIDIHLATSPTTGTQQIEGSSGSGSTSASSAGCGATGATAAATGVIGGGAKSKTKTYFFSTSKNNSANSASGSDNNRTSDHNNTSNKSRSGNATRNSTAMKVNAKELTLESAKPPSTGVVPNTQQAGNDTKSATSKDTKDVRSSTGAGGGAPVYGDAKRKVPSTKHSRQRDETASKLSELSPTDMSDSSDSDENKPPFVSTAECTSTHEGRQLMHTILPINIDTLFNLLFTKSKFLVDFHDMRKSTDTNFGDWATNEDGQRQRIVNVTVQLAASVGPKTSKVTEVQVMRECSKPGELYSIDINSVNAGIPYADSFSVLMHYCMVRTVDDHTMLSVHAQIKYKKSIWGVVKGFIEKNTWAGLEDFFTSLLHSLQSETCIPPAKGKGRRPRRGTASQIRPIEEISTIPQSKVEAAEKLPAASALIHVHHPAKPKHNVIGLTVSDGGEQRGGRSKWLSVFVILMLCFLIALNAILLTKLWRLEQRIEDDMSSRARMPNLASLKQLPNSHQEWIELLRQQEILHETELKKWHVVLQTAIELLKKTERTLAALIFH